MNPLIKMLLKKVIKIVYSDAIYPLAKSYVESTSNTYDDKALAFLDDIIDELLKKL
jgi:hypothetical protein